MTTIDLTYRPDYWPDAPTTDQLVSSIRGQARRNLVARDPSLMEMGGEWLTAATLTPDAMNASDVACTPAPGAIIKRANGIVDYMSDNCIGCGYCLAGCPFNVPRISKDDGKAYKCTLCSDRLAVGLEPACVKTCPLMSLSLAAGLLGTFYHYVTRGPKDEEPGDES